MSETTVFGWYSAYHDTVYPLTIVHARYHGVYEGGRYLAFPCDPDEIPSGWNGGDCECAAWFDKYEDAPIGRGSTPAAAHEDLLRRLLAATPTAQEGAAK